MSLPTQLYNRLKQIAPFEFTNVLWLNTHEFLPAKPVAGAQCRPLSSVDIHKLSIIKDFDISKQFANDFEAMGFTGIGMFVDEKLAGFCVFSTETVPAQYNKSKMRFNGIEIQLPPGTRCLIKAVVLPAFRGQRLNSAMVRYAIDHFGKDTVNAIVTTTEVGNHAFLSSVLDQGFESVGKSIELSVLGKSIYRLPKPIDSNSGEPSNDEDGCIVLAKAA